MIFHEYGVKDGPAVMFLHGGGLSYWMWRAQIEALQKKYRVITAVIDGHGEAAEVPFESIQKCATETIGYAEKNCNGKLFAICGLSLGAQIAVEMLSRNGKIAQKAIIESALVIPQELLRKNASASVKMSYPLIKKRWFARLQAKQLKIPDDMFEDYFRDSAAMSRESLINMLEENSAYKLPESFKETRADILVLCGGKEMRCIKDSAELIDSSAPKAELRVLPGLAHGEMTINNPQEYINMALKFFESPVVK